MHDDPSLLRAYATHRSEAAFRALVERHLGLVLSTARRLVGGDVHCARDIAQTVFTDLAGKAPTLPPDVVLAGWLHRHTCFTATKLVRSEQRRRNRERTAMEMNSLHEPSGRDVHWRQLAPVLDEALDQLGTDDRHAVVLRYLERRDLRAIGQVLRITEDAAQKRISRALLRLREHLARRGITFSAVALATTLEAAPATAVTSGFAAEVAAHALTAAAADAVTFVSALKTMIASKTANGLTAALALGTLTTVLIGQNSSNANSTSNAPVSTASATPSSARSAPPPNASKASPPAAASAGQTMTAGVMPAQPSDAIGSSGSQSMRMINGKMIVTTTKDGVTTTETIPVTSAGTTITTSNGAGGMSFGPSPAGTKKGATGRTVFVDKDGVVHVDEKYVPPSANGTAQVSATASSFPSDAEPAAKPDSPPAKP